MPSGVKILNWLATMWGGRIKYTVAMCFSISLVAMFTIGGLSGVSHAFAPAVLDDNQELSTYCTIGGRAATTWFVLTHLIGRDRVRVYDGSWAEWGRVQDTPVEGPQLTT